MAASGVRRALAKPAGSGRFWSGKADTVDAFDVKADAPAVRDTHLYFTANQELAAIRQGDWKLFVKIPQAAAAKDAPEKGKGKAKAGAFAPVLYDLAKDPGETTDGIFTYDGKGLGWDIYGHSAGDALRQGEDPADHGKAFPVILPTEQDQEIGLFYSGSPFFGGGGFLPPNTGGFNPNNGYCFMWHSHAEREIVNNNAFPGGMLTMLVVEPWP